MCRLVSLSIPSISPPPPPPPRKALELPEDFELVGCQLITGLVSIVGDAVNIGQIRIDLETRIFPTFIGANPIFPKWDIERFHENPVFSRKYLMGQRKCDCQNTCALVTLQQVLRVDSNTLPRHGDLFGIQRLDS